MVAAGAKADLIVLETNPLEDIGVFERFRSEMPLILKGGEVKRRQLT